MTSLPLNGADWTLNLERGEAPIAIDGVEADVPGCVHLDLLRSALIPDPYVGLNENDVQWIGACDFRYAAVFDVSAALLEHERVDLHCAELDTAATVYVNGNEVGSVCNQHHPHTFDAKPHLVAGQNHLEIVFRSALHVAEQNLADLGDLPRAGPGTNEIKPHNFIRKMSCNMGWDWGPCLITCGITGPIELRAFDVARLKYVRPLTTDLKNDDAVVDVLVDLDRATGKPLDVRAKLISPGGEVVGDRTVVADGPGVGVSFTVKHPDLWWPVGHGDQPLYTLEVELLDADEVLDTFDCRVGIRITRLDQREDDAGSRFAWYVNGRPIVARGANWIPDDCFPVRVDRDRLRQRLTSAVDANVNMLRIWGGGLYASHDLLDLCDELGLMVAQDFLFACAAYSEEEPFYSQVEAEVRHQVCDLSRHASLVHWNGCNENLWGYQDWSWEGVKWKQWLEERDRTWGAGYYFELLPKAILELDPTRPYTPGSPFSKVREEHPQNPMRGTVHVWPQDHSALEYRRLDARLANEFGQQGPATYSTFADVIPEDRLVVGNKDMEHRQRAHGGNEGRIDSRVKELFGVDKAGLDFDTWHYLAQLHQAKAVAVGIEWWRSRFPHNMGTVYWQWNDCWPVTSWAALDSNGRRKLLWYTTRRAYQPRLVTIQPKDPGDYAAGDDLVAVVLNDTAEPWQEEIIVRRLDFKGQELVRINANIAVPPFDVARLELSPAKLQTPGDPAGELLVAEISGAERATWFFKPQGDLAAPPPDYTATVSGKTLTIDAQTLLRDVCVFPDRLSPTAEVDRNLVTLLPGEAATFTLTEALDPDKLTTKPVLRVLGDHVA